MTSRSSSAKTATASSNEMPCLARFDRAFSSSHSKSKTSTDYTERPYSRLNATSIQAGRSRCRSQQVILNMAFNMGAESGRQFKFR